MAKKAKTKTTVSPSEAPETSAASSINPDVSNDHDTHWQFVPDPMFSAKWWEDNHSDGCLGHDESYSPGSVSADSWIIKFMFGLEACCLMSFDCPTPYPTATDALLWLRIEVLPWLAEHPASMAVALDAIDRIDTAPPGTEAAVLLMELRPSLIQAFPFIEISMICPIHEWLSTQGTQAEFRACYRTKAISCEDGRWSMPQLWWDRLAYDLANNEMEYLSVPDGTPKGPWPPELRE